MIFAVLICCVMGIQTSRADDFINANIGSAASPLRIVDSIPQPDAGIINSSRVHDDTSFAVLIESEHGFDLTDGDSIRFLISDGEFDPYERNLNSSTVRLVEVDNSLSPAILLWAVYDRSLEPSLPPVYPLESVVQVFLEVADLHLNAISATDGHFRFKTESDHQQAHAFNNLPESVFFNPDTPNDHHDRGIKIASGVSKGAKILYSADEPILPAFGPMGEIEPLVRDGEQAVGNPLNLMPHTVFDIPIKLFLPFPESTDITNLDIYYHNGVQWLAACDADGKILPGGKGWMVPGSRVNHPEQTPPQIEIEVFHFSAAQAVVAESSSATADTQPRKTGSGAVVHVSCFIHAAVLDSETGYGILGLFSALSLLIFLVSKSGKHGGLQAGRQKR